MADSTIPSDGRRKNGGARVGAGRKRDVEQEMLAEAKLDRRKLVGAIRLQLIAADYEALLQVTREIIRRLGVAPESYSNNELIQTAKTITTRFERATTEVKRSQNTWLQLRFAVLERDQFRCRYCGRTPLSQDVELHVDHIMPRSQGGLDEIDNLLTACADCNVGKKDALLTARTLEKVLGNLENLKGRLD